MLVTCHHYSLLQLMMLLRLLIQRRLMRILRLRLLQLLYDDVLLLCFMLNSDVVTAAWLYCDAAIFRACCHGPLIAASICCRRWLAQQRLLRLRLLSCQASDGYARRRQNALRNESCHSRRWGRLLLLLTLRCCPPVALMPCRDPACRRCRIRCICFWNCGDTTGISLRLIVHIVAWFWWRLGQMLFI